MTQLEELRTAFEREMERARQNIEDIDAVQERVWLNLAKSRALRDEAAKVQASQIGGNERAVGGRARRKNLSSWRCRARSEAISAAKVGDQFPTGNCGL